ncbi:nuclear transport factor 2 family protein [Amycolatopsis sp. NPDC049252]|uniref:nuclear transport factor 2 family protein n=1 Tax=Amycolatopsis sp. NPDC049252 TaxID=3363933 RepID=UPI00371354C8
MPLKPEDYEAIRGLYGRYSMAVDTGDLDAFVACFAPDADYSYEGLPEHLGRNGSHVGHEAIRALAADIWAGTQGHVTHVQVPQTISGDGDEAQVVVYDHVLRRGPAPHAGVIHTATAEDTLVRLGDGWVFKVRVGHIHIHDTTPEPTDVLVQARDSLVAAVHNSYR